MDTPPVPKPRSVVPAQNDQIKQPVPLPRTKVSNNNEKPKSTSLMRSLSTVSKITGDVANKVASTTKSAREDSSKFAKETLEKTLSTSRAMIDSTKSSLKLRRLKKFDTGDNADKHVSMPCMDTSMFENIHFQSPMLEQKQHRTENLNELPSLQLNTTFYDDLSVFSSNSDSNTESVSDFSRDSAEFEHSHNLHLEGDQTTYDTPRQSRTNSMISDRIVPEPPERRKKRASEVSMMRNNSLYENWTLPTLNTSTVESVNKNLTVETTNNNKVDDRPSKSMILLFDPLNTTSSTKKYDGVSNELLLLESFLIGDTYGSIISTDTHDDVMEFPESDYFNPPTPPERSDSLLTAPETTDVNENNNEVPPDTDSVQDNPKPIVSDVKKPQSVMHKFSQILKLDNVLNKPTKQENLNVQIIERPPINMFEAPYFCGIITRITSTVTEDLFKNSQSRYCVLSNKKLMCYTDPTNSILKEAYTLDYVYSIQLVLPISSSTTNNSFCFEIMVSGSGGKHSPRKVVFSCTNAALRRSWTHSLVAHLTTFPVKYTSDFTRCGWCYLKEGVTGEWQGAWLILHRRVLAYYTTRDSDVCTVDLRKTRCVVTQEAEDETKKSCQTECANNLLLDCPQATLYLHFPHERELKSWRFMIRLAAHNNGTYLHHQQLTKEDVPVIVEKCLSFVYAHGSLSEGIYRRAGSNSMIADLLTGFRRDAWSLQLCHGQHSEHDVAGVLKRFFRDLPESLIPQNKHQELIDALAIPNNLERHQTYRRIFSSLPLVPANTARKLFAHLHFLQSMMYANKMGAENLAAVWAPTIMPQATTSEPNQQMWMTCMHVIKDLIVNFESIWEPTEAEKRREAAIRRVLVKVYGTQVPVAPKAAGDLRTWIYVNDKTTCYQVALTPNKTSSDLCIELAEKANTYSHLLMLEEVVCDNAMRRIVHINEVVLDVVLRWSYWDEEDRKENYLLLSKNTILHEMEAKRDAPQLNATLKFANETTKTFKSHIFGVHSGSLVYFKDKQGAIKAEEWKIQDHLWYLGHEVKRNPQGLWAITFIPKNNKPKRSREKPWFGCTISSQVAKNDIKWLAAITFAEHTNILPTPRLIDTK
ncbi:arf-GAP with Rho-GAP domain, ANK repeat and PH domain-containing protein 2 isoform X1 [Galleria mellonella]|uniref:Arf-GAP with Rho-GAP domain, ANK repeat and PH domain-containing protein 2 isoform X1 n=1 Tax=Galleria mellonella TaxID=7137 RepID=A0A6J1X3M2_GALME|nr:arf-GAP with Rho-GAP domain, ANK repeat and PH domain-containing protein 2 isoform X1 [Galleria mellonella]